MSEENFNPMQRVKRSLYAMRNGIVADGLRRAGCPYRLVFGVNLPQLNDIAAAVGKDAELAEALWADSDLRESALLAPMIYPHEKLTRDKAGELAAHVKWPEDADILCFKLLRFAHFAGELAATLASSEEPLKRYTGLRLYFCTLDRHPEEALKAAEAELARPDSISGLASMLADEARFLLAGE